MANLQVDTELPQITPPQSLAGWRRELCIELLGDGAARIFVRAVEASSFKAAELKRAILFQRVSPRFTDLAGCVDALRKDLEHLADSARRIQPDKEQLFATVTYDHASWDRVQNGIDHWSRR